MMKIAAYIIVVFFLFPFKGQCESSLQQSDSVAALFQLFLTDFTDHDRKDIDILTFGDMIFHQRIDKDKYGMFLPESDDCDCSEEYTYWQQGSFLQKGNIVVVFMHRYCYDDEFYSYCDYMVATYTRDGRLIDSKSVGRIGRLYNFRMEGDVKHLRIVSECGELMDPEELRDYGDLMYSMEKKKFEVCKDGRIKESRVGKQWVETVQQKDGIIKDVTFDEYMDFFTPWESDKVSKETFYRKGSEELKYSYRKTFLPYSVDCGCKRRNSRWTPAFRKETEDYIIVFFQNFCDYPKDDIPFYNDFVIATYSKDGHIIDIKDIARSGDYWVPQIDDSSTTSSITVRQGFIDEKNLNLPVKPVNVVVSRYVVLSNGEIHQETIKTYHTTCHWDKEKKRIVF